MSDSREHARIDAEISRTGRSSDPFAAAVRATRMPMLITDPNLPDNPIVFANGAFLTLTGYERDEVMGRNCRFLQGPETSQKDIGRVREAIDRRAPIEVDLLNYRKDGTHFWNRLLLSPVFDSDGKLTYFFASQFDVTLQRERIVRLEEDRDALEREMDMRNRELVRSEESMRFAMRAAGIGTWSLDLQTQRLVTSDLCKRSFGFAPRDAFAWPDLLEAIQPADRERIENAFAEATDDHRDFDEEFRVMRPDGSLHWLQMRGRPQHGADDRPISFAGVVLDVTERRRGEEQRLLLTAELRHRVKNSMATMQSIATQTLRNARSTGEAATQLNARLQSLSAAHDLTTREDWRGATLPELSQAVLALTEPEHRHRFRVGGPDIPLPSRMALALVLALHELVSNAGRYGALRSPDGYVILDWEVIRRAQGEELRLRWEEHDGPTVTPPARRGFGLKMIETALAAEFGGKAEVEFRPLGIRFELTAPLPEMPLEGRRDEEEAIFRRHFVPES